MNDDQSTVASTTTIASQMSGFTPGTKQLIRKIALRIVREHRENVRNYEETCAIEHRQGYRPSHCFHGMNLWVDYDVICPGCEDGTFSRWTEGTELYTQALEAAISDYTHMMHQNDVLLQAVRLLQGAGLREEMDMLLTKSGERLAAQLSRMLTGH